MVKALAAEKIATVLVNIDEPETKVRPFYATRKTGTAVAYDDTTGTKLAWNILSVPTVVYLDLAGEVAYNGPAVWADLATAVNKGLAGSGRTVQFGVKGTQYG